MKLESAFIASQYNNKKLNLRLLWNLQGRSSTLARSRAYGNERGSRCIIECRDEKNFFERICRPNGFHDFIYHVFSTALVDLIFCAFHKSCLRCKTPNMYFDSHLWMAPISLRLFNSVFFATPNCNVILLASTSLSNWVRSPKTDLREAHIAWSVLEKILFSPNVVSRIMCT